MHIHTIRNLILSVLMLQYKTYIINCFASGVCSIQKVDIAYYLCYYAFTSSHVFVPILLGSAKKDYMRNDYSIILIVVRFK